MDVTLNVEASVEVPNDQTVEEIYALDCLVVLLILWILGF